MLTAWALVWSTPALPQDSQGGAPAVSNEPALSETPAADQKQRTRSAVVLMAIVTGIALTGLLLMIMAVAARGLARKMAGSDASEPHITASEPRPIEPPPEVPPPSSPAPPAPPAVPHD